MAMLEPRFWGSWKGRVIKAITIDDARTWDEIRDLTGLSPMSLNRALYELFELGVLEKTNSGTYKVGHDIDKEYKSFFDRQEEPDKSWNPEGQGNPVNGDGTDLDFIPFLTSPVGTINQRPVAVLDVDKTNPSFNETVTFDASGSNDDGRIDYYLFDFGDGTNSSWTTLPVVTHKYAAEGTYNATLIVMDDFGVTSLDGDLVFIEITVIPEFSSLIILPLFMMATLVAVIFYRRKQVSR